MKTSMPMQNAVSGRRKAAPHTPLDTRRAFTLIELLVVIGIIAILAAFTVQGMKAVHISMLRTRARGELVQLETAIERYHDKLGYYPPDNAPNWAVNQLYYELLGTTSAGGVYQTLDKSAQLTDSTASFQAAFGAASSVVTFRNCSRGGSDESSGAVAFLKGLKSSQFVTLPGGCTILGCSLDGPLTYPNPLGTKLNPWRYNSSSPQFNPKSFDLWIDVAAGSQTNRICNWSEKPLIVSTPY